MTKQKEIREVVWKFLVDYDKDNGNPAVDWAFILLHRLAEKGVVKKVDRELPKVILTISNSDQQIDMTADVGHYYKEAGYVAVESLFEVKNG